MNASPALHHKLLANHYGRLADQASDAGNAAQAAEYYALEAQHLQQREALGGQLGGQQPSAAMAAAYANG